MTIHLKIAPNSDRSQLTGKKAITASTDISNNSFSCVEKQFKSRDSVELLFNDEIHSEC